MFSVHSARSDILTEIEARCERHVMGLKADVAHDPEHIRRVVANARHLAGVEGARLEIVVPAAWLHDCVVVPKDSPDRPRASRLAAIEATRLLRSWQAPADWLPDVAHAIEAHSFSAGIRPSTIEAGVLQDADRLDALGAVGLGRVLMLGATLGRPLYVPEDPFCERREPDDMASSVDHFYTKLLGLASTFTTATGREAAKRRTETLRGFLDELRHELAWTGRGRRRHCGVGLAGGGRGARESAKVVGAMSKPVPPPDDAAPTASIADRLRAATEVLEIIVADRGLLGDLSSDERTRLIQAAGAVHTPDVQARRRFVKSTAQRRRAEAIARNERLRHETGIRELRRRPVFTTPNVFPPPAFTPDDVSPGADDAERQPDTAGDRNATEPRGCYTCKRKYQLVHHFYDQLCPECAELNYRKRTELADLGGRVALLTGGRVKIGYQAGLKLLRCGAHLIVTTRFPRDSAARYAAEPDFGDWGHRLEIFGLDLRHTPSVEAFCQHLIATRDRLDFIINNACQTVRRPPDFYAHMMEGERAARQSMPPQERRLLGAYEGLRGYHMLPEADAAGAGLVLGQNLSDVAGLTHAAELSQVALLPEEQRAQKDLFPEGRLDQDLQQIDLRGRNSWRLLLDEVSSVELLEVQLVNAVAPFVLNARLKPLMLKTADRDKHIVNVSAVEGQFYRRFKTTRHPHTNMAKAALNMMTRTAATDFHNDGIHMNSVDTGWVTDEDPAEIAARKTAEHYFHPPLDIVDGAARIVDPIITGFNTGEHIWGQFLKDYKRTDW